MRVVLGIGCDRGAAAATIEAAVAAALAEAGVAASAVAAVATLDLKRDEPGLQALVGRHGWPLYDYPAAELAAIAVPSPSETVRRHTGTPAVAEAAALRCAGAGIPALLVEKRRLRGEDGRSATASVARLDGGGGA